MSRITRAAGGWLFCFAAASAAVVQPSGSGYEVRAPGLDRPVLVASAAAKVNVQAIRVVEAAAFPWAALTRPIDF